MIAFADDVTILGTNYETHFEILQTFDNFSNQSGARLNQEKTKYLTSGTNLLPSNVNTFNVPFKILGFWFDLNGPNYPLIISDLKEYIDSITSQKKFKFMSMKGRAKVTNTLIYAKLNYYTKIIIFKRKIAHFIWN